jgi:hypothetical protein
MDTNCRISRRRARGTAPSVCSPATQHRTARRAQHRLDPAVIKRANEDLDLAANPDPVGVPVRFPDGGISVHLGDGEWQDIDRAPGAFTAARLWPSRSNGVEDYRLYDHTGMQVAQADVAIFGDRAHIANIEAEGGANTLGIKALRILQGKLQEEFPELTAVKGLRSSRAEARAGDLNGLFRAENPRPELQGEPLRLAGSLDTGQWLNRLHGL